jgi:hypothetical protein
MAVKIIFRLLSPVLRADFPVSGETGGRTGRRERAWTGWCSRRTGRPGGFDGGAGGLRPEGRKGLERRFKGILK